MTKRQEYTKADEKKLFDYIGYRYPYNRPKSQWERNTIPEKHISIADPHEPYGSIQVFTEIEKHHKDSSVVIVPGDLSDYYSKSRFLKHRHVKFADEVRSTFMRLEWLSTHFKDVYIMIGNHDNRPEKQIQRLFENNIDLQLLTEQNLLKRLASYFDNIEVVGTQLNGDIELTHIWQFHDIVFTHAEKSMTQKSALMGTISQQLFKWQKALKLKSYKVIAQGHNHFSLKMTMGRETWFLLPSAAEPKSVGFEYVYSTRMIGDPACTGYSLFYIDNGETDINKSNNYLI